jgi:hypothetical protein
MAVALDLRDDEEGYAFMGSFIKTEFASLFHIESILEINSMLDIDSLGQVWLLLMALTISHIWDPSLLIFLWLLIAVK